MFNYLKLFSFFTVLCNFLLLLSDQVFFNDFLDISINPDFASKYSFIKLKSGLYRPLTQTVGRGILKSTSKSSNISSGSGSQQKHVSFQLGPQGPRNAGPCPPIGSSTALARLLNRALGTSSSSGTRFTGSSSGQTASTSTGFRGSSSSGAGAHTGNPLTSAAKLKNPGLQSRGYIHSSSGGDGKVPACYNPNCRPLTKPVGCLSVSCPSNPNGRHFIKPGAGGRQHCKYCD